jgi:hypothetical protein
MPSCDLLNDLDAIEPDVLCHPRLVHDVNAC